MRNSRETIVVSADVLSAVLERARSRPDAEIVGFLSGRQLGVATRDVPLTNEFGGKSTFLVDPQSQFLAERRIAALGEEIVAIYHSHPAGDATISDLDVHFASAWSCAHIVIGLQPTLEARAYMVKPGARVGAVADGLLNVGQDFPSALVQQHLQRSALESRHQACRPW